MSRPASLPDDVAELYDWLAANGVDEWVPDHPVVVVHDGQITYTAWKFTGERGWNMQNVAVDWDAGQVLTESRTVPLLVAPTDRVRFLATVAGMALIEG